MFDFNSLIAGFEQRRQQDRQEAQARANAEDAREFAILQALAQHPDPEAAALGGAGLLQLASPKPGKGLKGFMGEIERSSYYPQVREWMQARGTPGAQPGTGALPDGSPVEPKRQGPGAAPPLATGPQGGAPTGPQAPQGPQGPAAPLGPYGQAAAEALLPPEGRAPQGPAPMGAEAPGAAAEGPPGPPVLGSRPVTPLPPRPETPQAKYRRLYPTAGELAGEQAYQQQFNWIKAALDLLTQHPEQEDFIRGMKGSPSRRYAPQAFTATFTREDGTPGKGTVVFDPNTRTFSDEDGKAVSDVVKLPTSGGSKPTAVDVVGPDGTLQRQWVTPEPGMVVERGITPSTPPDFQGFQRGPDGMLYGMPRQYGQEPWATGVQSPPTGSYVDPDAQGMLATVQQEIRAIQTPNMMGQRKAVTAEMADEIVRRLSKGKWRSFADLNAASRPRPMSQAPQYTGADDMTARKNRIRGRLQGGTGSAGSAGAPPPGPGVIQGAGLPPG